MEFSDRSCDELLLAAKKQLNDYQDKQQPVSSAHKKKRSHSRGNSVISNRNMEEIINAIPSPPLSRSSSHRRHSSVSTRRESAELMGIALQDDDQRDSERAENQLRTLLALEGKSASPLNTAFSFTKVELPDFGSETEKNADTGKGPFSLNNSLSGKRDSFGKLLTPNLSTKKELGTLLEEDEGDEGHHNDSTSVVPRPRPRSLNIRPASFRSSLTLPTPSPTPPLRQPKLKSLTLASSTVVTSSPKSRRTSLLAAGSPSSSLSITDSEPSTRRSSLSYMSSGSTDSHVLLPNTQTQTCTPSPSPTGDSHKRSLSPTELLAHSTFLSQSHASFLARIAALEAALARTSTPSPSLTEPSEELLEMLADLKSERDSLKKSFDDLRARCDDQEKEINSLGRRIDHERREGWVAKEKLNLVEAEKQSAIKERDTLHEQVASLKERLEASKAQLQIEKSARVKAENELNDALEVSKLPTTPYPYPTIYKYGSMDSPVVASFFQPSDDNSLKFKTESTSTSEAPSEPSLYSGSVSSAYSDAQLRHDRMLSTPEDRTNALSTGSTWSFANASRRRKSEPTVDRFFACLDDFDNEATLSSPTKVTSSSDHSIGLGFGFDVTEEDSTFNFGQPTTPPAVADEDKARDEQVGSVPFLEEEDTTFSFGQEVIIPKSMETPPISTPRASRKSKPPVPNTFNEPSTPTPRHRAKDSLQMRRRYPSGKDSMDFTWTSSDASSLSSHSPSFAFPSPSTSEESSTICTSQYGVPKPMPRVIAAPIMLSPPPPRKTPTNRSLLSGTPNSPPSRPVAVPQSPSRNQDSTLRPILKIPSVPVPQTESELIPRTPSPMCSPARSPLGGLSFSTLASLLPASWSSKPTPITPVSPVRRDSIERARLSRERQLNRLRSESLARESISSDGGSFRGFTGL